MVAPTSYDIDPSTPDTRAQTARLAREKALASQADHQNKADELRSRAARYENQVGMGEAAAQCIREAIKCEETAEERAAEASRLQEYVDAALAEKAS